MGSSTSGCTGSKARGTPCENTVPFPTKSFVCLVFNDSKPSLWWFVEGCALCHPAQELIELGLTRIPPHPTGPQLGCAKFNIILGLFTDVDSGSLHWTFPNTAAQLLNKADKIKKIIAREIPWHSKRARTDHKSSPPTPVSTGH